MSDEKKDTPLNPLVPIAAVCAMASIAIAMFSLLILHQISDGGMWAIAAMSMAPSAMGVGMAFFLTRGNSAKP